MKNDLNVVLSEINEYVKNKTMGGYYGNNVQVVDLLKSTGDFEGFCRGSIIKYIARWGRKGEKKNVLDLYKSIHYIILLLLENENEFNKTNDWHFKEF